MRKNLAAMLTLTLLALCVTAQRKNAQKMDNLGVPDSAVENIDLTSYPFTALTGVALEDMSSGTMQLIGSGADNEVSPVAPIGFLLRYNTTSRTVFSVSANGFLKLGSEGVGPATFNTFGTSAGPNTPMIAPFWDNLCVASNGKVHYKTIMAAAGLKTIIEWRNMKISRGGVCDGSGSGTFQLWIMDGGSIQFVYGDGMTATMPADGGYSVGLLYGDFISVTTAGNTVNTVSANNTQTSAIPSGTSYLFAPPVPAPPTNAVLTGRNRTALMFDWTDNSNNETGFLIRRSTDNVNFADAANVTANTTRWSEGNLTPGTQYFYNIYAVTAGGLGAPLSFAATTSTSVAISGRVLTATGQPIRSASVTISGGNLPVPVVATTGNFGNYSFEGLEIGATYSIAVSAKRYRFGGPQAVILSGDVANVDFVANPQD